MGGLVGGYDRAIFNESERSQTGIMRREKLLQRRAARAVARENERKAVYDAHQRALVEQAAWDRILELNGLNMKRGTEGRFGDAVRRGGHDHQRDPERGFFM